MEAAHSKKSRLDKNRIYIHKNSFYHNFFFCARAKKRKEKKSFSSNREFRDEIKEYQREDFDRWSRSNLDDIESNELSMQTNAQVVYFEAGKDMKVSYLF